jgi:hypothetical protein
MKGGIMYQNWIGPMDYFPDDINDKSLVRDWWHEVLRDYGRYSCFAIFLVLQADKEAIRYLTDYAAELDAVSGKFCLVLAIGETEIKYDEYDWKTAVQEQASAGYSIGVGEVFDIPITGFPCIVLFHDIRSPEHIVVDIKGMNAEDIAGQVRTIFAIVREAAEKKNEPLAALAQERQKEMFRRAGKSIVSEIQVLAGKTFETAVEATVKAFIK